MNKTERLHKLLSDLTALGFTFAEAQRLRRIQLTLHRWAEAECNGEIQRDDKTGKPVRVFRTHPAVCYVSPAYPQAKEHRNEIPDREAGALKRLASIMANHPELWAYHQTDPRGCALYVGRKSDLKTDENQIVRKARGWGAVVTCKPSGFVLQESNGNRIGGHYDNEEAAARAFLESKGAKVPARYSLPLDQYYNRGLAVCV